MKRNLFVIAVILGALLYAYWGVWNIFYQQDEWLSLGIVQANGIPGGIFELSPIEIFAGRGRILGSLLNNVIDSAAPLRPDIFYFMALMFHFINACILYGILSKLTRSRLISVTGALFFTVNATASQSLTWMSSHASVLPNGFFVLFGIYLFLLYKEKSDTRYLYAAFVTHVAAFYFKETSLVMSLWFPIADYLISRKKPRISELFVRYSPLAALFLLFGIIRFAGLFAWGGEPGVMVSGGGNPIPRTLFRLAFYPTIGFMHLFIPSPIVFRLAGSMSLGAYDLIGSHPMRQALVYTLISDIVVVYMCIVAGILLGAFWIRFTALRRHMLLSLSLVLLSFLPFAALERPASAYFESRYYYLGSIGASYFFGIVAYGLWAAAHAFPHRVRVLSSAVILVFLGLYLAKQGQYIRRDIGALDITSRQRRAFLWALDAKRGELSDRPVIYIEGDSPGFYGIHNLSVPFQQGMGYTAMVWFYDTGKIPKELLRTAFLWNINAQGYREVGDKGFGYFSDRKMLWDAFSGNPALTPAQVIGFSYRGASKELIDITGELRAQLSQIPVP